MVLINKSSNLFRRFVHPKLLAEKRLLTLLIFIETVYQQLFLRSFVENVKRYKLESLINAVLRSQRQAEFKRLVKEMAPKKKTSNRGYCCEDSSESSSYSSYTTDSSWSDSESDNCYECDNVSRRKASGKGKSKASTSKYTRNAKSGKSKGSKNSTSTTRKKKSNNRSSTSSSSCSCSSCYCSSSGSSSCSSGSNYKCMANKSRNRARCC